MANFPDSTGIMTAVRNTVMLSTIVQPASYTFTDYIPFPGTDVSAGQILGPAYPASGCNNVCSLNAACFAFSTSYGNCFLRSTNLNPTTNNNTVSYYQVKPARLYVIYNSIDYIQPNMIFYNGDLRHCRQACDALPGCVGYVNSYFCFILICRLSLLIVSNVQ